MLNSTFTSQFQLDGTGHTTSSMSLVRNSNNGGSPYLTLGKSRSTSVNGTGLVSSGDGLGVISFQGGDGTHLQEGAAVLAQVDGTAATDNMPGRLVFLTNSGSTSSTERLRIDSDGRMGLGTNSPDSYDGEADNFVVASSDHTGITIASTGSSKRTNLYF